MVGIASLLVTSLWMHFTAFHPLVILLPYSLGWFCIGLTSLWQMAKDLPIKVWFITSPVRFYLVGFIACFLLVGFFDLYFIFDIDQGQFPFGEEWDNIVVESHGLLFDLFVLGILLAIYDRIKENRRQEEEETSVINRYLEELDDFRPWKSEESKYRIRGIVKRLMTKGYTNIDFRYLDLKEIELENARLSKAHLLETDFSGAKLIGANFQEATIYSSYFLTKETLLSKADFSNARIYGSKFNDAYLLDADFSNAILSNCDFSGADLRGVVFQSAYLYDTKLEGSEVLKDFLDRLQKWDTKGQLIHTSYTITKVEVAKYSGNFRYLLKIRE